MTAAITFVIPAFNAAATIRSTLSSLAAQTRPDWACVVVDDGSTDDTLAIVSRLAGEDARIRAIGSRHGGPCGARNTGLAAATSEWICFLDADDRVAPRFVERMLAAGEGADLVYCGYERVLASGTLLCRSLDPMLAREGFACLARYCPAAIHCFVTRRRLLDAAGGFDRDLEVCEDWDLWQRLARTGIRIAMVDDVLSVYVMGAATLSTKSALMLRDGLRVLATGHGADPRVPNPDPRYAAGLDPSGLPVQAVYFTAWCAAAECGAGGDFRPLLDGIDVAGLQAADTPALSAVLVDGVIVGSRTPAEEIVGNFAVWKPTFAALAQAVAARHRLAGYDHVVLRGMEARLHGILGDRSPARIDLTSRVSVDLSALSGLATPTAADVVFADLMHGRRRLATLEIAGIEGVDARVVTESAIDQIGLARFIRTSGIWKTPRFWNAVASGSVREAVAVGRMVRRRRSLGLLAARSRGRAVMHDAAIRAAAGRRSSPAASTPARRAEPIPPTPEVLGGDRPAVAASSNSTYWEEVFAAPDPWKYTSAYEQRKYERTLELLPPGRDLDVLELACAEGLFTVQLAPRVGRLLAADISATAIERARARCQGADNVEFARLDIAADPIPGGKDVILCSEVLYYLESNQAIADVAAKLRDALVPGGRIVMANHFLLRDDMSATGFDWDQRYGAKVLHEHFLATPGLALERSVVTDLYRIDVFRRLGEGLDPPAPEITRMDLGCRLEPSLARFVVWNGATARRRDVERELTFEVPVLAYHRIAEDGPEGLRRWRVRPGDFEAQLRLLRSAGYHAITSTELVEARRRRTPISGRPVLITFDDAYLDTAETAWPILQENDFTAEVFVVTDLVGTVAAWDADLGPPAPLMDWSDIVRLEAEGLRFASHLATHTPAPHLSSAELLGEAVRSKAALEERLVNPVRSLAAPYGAVDRRLVQVCRVAGYEIGYSCDAGRASVHDPRFMMPRIEVDGAWPLERFAATLGLAR